MKKLKEMGVREMDAMEMKTNNGGDFGIGAAILIGLAIAAGAEILGDWDNFKNGLKGLPENK